MCVYMLVTTEKSKARSLRSNFSVFEGYLQTGCLLHLQPYQNRTERHLQALQINFWYMHLSRVNRGAYGSFKEDLGLFTSKLINLSGCSPIRSPYRCYTYVITNY